MITGQNALRLAEIARYRLSTPGSPRILDQIAADFGIHPMTLTIWRNACSSRIRRDRSGKTILMLLVLLSVPRSG
ncbi:hypothetical protein [Nocardia sp. NBC_00403]|uniref:hypothetical protein n=1 Tax=Nocardia sp. NBC_00403 TaxID=2975990 RepID=UPI002E243AAF